MAILLASLGLITTLLTIVLSVVPADDDPHKSASIAKLLGSTGLLAGAGVLVYWKGRRAARVMLPD